MFRRSAATFFAATAPVLSGGGGVERYAHKESPNMPHGIAKQTSGYPKAGIGMTPQSFFDTNVSLYDDYVNGVARVRWQEPAKTFHAFAVNDALMMEEHDKEEWNELPYTGVQHLYEPPVGCKDRPIRIEAAGNPGDHHIILCIGNCAPHIPWNPQYIQFKSYKNVECQMCHQWFYIHNRPWLVVHPDWTDEPADDEGPAFTFAEVEAEFDRDFHEFSVYLNYE